MSQTGDTTGTAVSYMRCQTCGSVQLPLGGACTTCRSPALAKEYARGTGTIYSYTSVKRPPSQAFAHRVPYVILLVDMDEGFRLMANLAPDDVTEPWIGARVTVLMTSVGDTVTAVGRLLKAEA